MKLAPDDIQTKEVLDWKGLHLLNFSQSSCSQKVRIFLAEKGVEYQSRNIDLKNGEHTKPWYLGINPRGVVPVLIHDGDVHIESNDILRYIEDTFPTPGHAWIPGEESQRELTEKLLDLEDELHTHIRVATMGFMFPQAAVKKSEAELEAYAKNGADDPHRDEQIAWWRAFGEHGITDQQARDAVVAFQGAFSQLNDLLGDRDWLLGDKPTVLDIAWFITLYRAVKAGYPIEVHPALHALYERMVARPSFQRELEKGPAIIRIAGPVYRAFRRLQGTTLKSVYDKACA